MTIVSRKPLIPHFSLHRDVVLFLLAAAALLFLPTSLQASTASEFSAAWQGYVEATSSGDSRAAVEHARRAYELAPAVFGESHGNTAATALNYGNLLVETGQAAVARNVLETALDRYEATYGKNAVEVVDPLMSLGEAWAAPDNAKKAEGYFKRALRIAGRELASEVGIIADLNVSAGVALAERAGEADLGMRYLERAYEMQSQVYGSQHPATGATAYYIARHHMADGDVDAALPLLEDAHASFENPDHPQSGVELRTHALLLQVRETLGQRDAAAQHAVAIARVQPFTGGEPQPLFVKAPDYPRLARQAGVEGYAVIDFTLAEDGTVQDATVADFSGSKSFGPAAIAALEGYRFAPRVVDDEPVPTEGVSWRVDFQLRGVQAGAGRKIVTGTGRLQNP